MNKIFKFLKEFMVPISIVLIWILFVIFMTSVNTETIGYTRLPNHNGCIAKFDFEGHSYIGYTCNLGAGLVHDPDCKCKADLHEKKEK